MATMSMNKVIHGAIRRDLKRFADATAAFTDGDKARAAALGRAWDNFDLQLTHHHEGEHEIAWPAMLQLGVTQAEIDGFDGEHDAMAASLAEARTAITAFRSSATATDAAANAKIGALAEVTNTHLDHEEARVEKLMLDEAENPVIQEMGKKFSKVPPTTGGVFFAWVADGASAEERAALEAFVPKPVLTIIGGIFGRSYRRNVATVWR